MKRDPRLRGLSSEHHQGLVLARWLTEGRTAWTPADAAKLAGRFERELAPHFAVEEELLLPALRDAGEATLAGRLLADHDFLRARLAEARAGDAAAALAFGERLREHIRFEERELFPACEEKLPGAVLDAVLHRAPKGAPTPSADSD